ncbi:hypothetical protein GNZ10_13750 [Ralstonia sp. 3N]|uniref:hypothetical protein n=1 Tax=Ralstonia sp. 3N TaxID=2675750 RepID=UPI0015C531FB|nr:hypothetical protein [Ralstonia sp. 3N]NPT50761.1 hypothetical protein [Ralstonia sp. 3N]
MDKNNGGPAFPAHCTSDGHAANVEDGMSLRDYFAAKAMQGLLSDTSLKGAMEEFADRAYQMADAMLRAREST